MLNLNDQDYLKNLSDEQLVNILFTEEDRVPRAVVNEFVGHGGRMIDYLWYIIAEDNNWRGDNKKWWAVIHATNILGAIGGKEVIIPLIMSLRFAVVFDCDWVWEALPSIFGKIGPAIIEPLKRAAEDQSNNWLVRSIVLDGLAAVTIDYPRLEKEIFDFIAMILKSDRDRMVRGSAGNILLDFNCKRYEKSLLEFAREEEYLFKQDKNYVYHFDEESVLQEFSRDQKRNLEQYTKDWLTLYEPQEIANRQKRWREDNSCFYFWLRWWRSIKWRFEFKKIKKRLEEENQK